jgi:hypothetical protein
MILEYMGDVDPDSANSAGTGYNFYLYEGDKQGSVVSDPDAVNGQAWYIPDSDIANTKWRSNPERYIKPYIGGTIVARVKCTASNSTGSDNLMILEDYGLYTTYHWGGPNGMIRENIRNQETTITGNDQYHILRLTTQNTHDSNQVINLYFDENPTPVIQITDASEATSYPVSDSFGFGAGSTSETQNIYFDWIIATHSGAFAPGEEEACLGRSLHPPCHNPFADADNDGDVDQDDFAEFQLCYTGSGGSIPSSPAYCLCFDIHPTGSLDGDIDSDDYTAFENCASGPNIPANITCDD